MATTMKILLVGQSAENLAALRETLVSDELEVVATANLGPAALTWARTVDPDLVVVAADDSVARPVGVIQALTHGDPPWTVVAIAERFEPELVRQAMLAGSRDVLVRTATAAELRQALVTARRADSARRAPQGQSAPHAAGSVIGVTGVKGGIGKTTVAVNLALSLALETDRSVALVDLDLPYGDVAMLLDVKPETNVVTAVTDPGILSDPDLLVAQLCSAPAGVQVLAAPLNGGASAVDGAQIEPLLKRLAGLYDFVVVDTTPGFGEYTAVALDCATHTLLVTTPEPPTLRRTELGLRQLAEWKYPPSKLKVVLNRATLRTGMRNEEIAAILSHPITWWLPDEPNAIQAVAAGRPIALAEPKSQVARTLRAMARQLGGLPERPRRSLLWPFSRSKPELAVARA